MVPSPLNLPHKTISPAYSPVPLFQPLVLSCSSSFHRGLSKSWMAKECRSIFLLGNYEVSYVSTFPLSSCAQQISEYSIPPTQNSFFESAKHYLQNLGRSALPNLIPIYSPACSSCKLPTAYFFLRNAAKLRQLLNPSFLGHIIPNLSYLVINLLTIVNTPLV